MIRTLVVTNDFPPRAGGIQTFVRQRSSPAGRSRSSSTPRPRRRPSSTPRCLSRGPAARLRSCCRPGRRPAPPTSPRRHGCDNAFFGAAAPLGLLAPALRSRRGPACVGQPHGHETGWVGVSRRPAAAAADRAGPRRADLHQRVHPPAARRRARRAHRPGPALARGRHRPRSTGRRRRRRAGRYGLRRPPGRGLRLPAGPAQGPGRADRGPGPRSWPASRGRRCCSSAAAGGASLRRLAHRVGVEPSSSPDRAVERPARPLRRRRRLRHAVPHPPPRARRRGARHRLPGGVPPACPWWPAPPAGRRRRCSTARPATWSTRALPAIAAPASTCSPTPPVRGDGRAGRAWVEQAWSWTTIAAGFAELLEPGRH